MASSSRVIANRVLLSSIKENRYILGSRRCRSLNAPLEKARFCFKKIVAAQDSI